MCHLSDARNLFDSEGERFYGLRVAKDLLDASFVDVAEQIHSTLQWSRAARINSDAKTFHKLKEHEKVIDHETAPPRLPIKTSNTGKHVSRYNRRKEMNNCERCGAPRDAVRLETHHAHILQRDCDADGWSLSRPHINAHALWNLMTLCEECHDAEHSK